MTPKFFVLARVISRDGALEFWRERLVHLCEVSKTEPYGDSYYWGYDLDGAKDTLWGLEGYTHPIGFFIDHVSSDIFKREMELVDKDRLLRTVQGLGSPDYDLHHYDQYGGYLKREDDPDADSKASIVFLNKGSPGPHRPAECTGLERMQGHDNEHIVVAAWEALQNSVESKSLAADIEPLTRSTEVHRSQVFNGHIGLKDKVVGTQV
ncbi:uncharacterized protein NECHADRAFT_85171 [Fusarium vanettenii 77-13-4]|uniref:ABM domain-containing protein n=1 Tax=Fusarium vanettenii (strain ATCC MYA-4622 / CBS 123669 / FGSC 9596 / NRRL 45880 / 77-13-4) TaxID=660122 RepID=C7YV69_FUSV7|nr:uncharacterized protein NECHADRAFT_85171 [Fusarium vanettenii 77-13-4]EEU44528.1 predicted protein [Fusarium vanettenii 77-13-4]